MRKLLFLSSILALVLVVPAPHAGAQFVPTTGIDDLKNLYRNLLSSYRTKEDQFSIAAQQYYTLKTLAAQEEAVRAAREVGLARVDTLLTYIQALQTTMEINSGIELTRKDALQRQLDFLVDGLKKHRSRIEIANDRLKIEAENDFMEDQQKPIEALCYQALSLIKMGSVQAALDQLVVTKDELDKYIEVAPISETARNEKRRGSEEIERSISNIRASLTKILTTYDEGVKGADSSLLRTIQDDLAPPYSTLTQAMEFVKELSNE